MAKYPYFDAIEALANIALRAVRLGCADAQRPKREDPISLRNATNKAVCELEDALFSDFLPPLERDDLAALTHALGRVVDRAIELSVTPRSLPQSRAEREEREICLHLAEQLLRDVEILKKIRHPKQMPALRDFRALLAKAERTPSRYAPLRAELACAFDTLVEVMLNNI